MSLKDNFNQAVKEILKKDGLVGGDLTRNPSKKSEIDKFMGNAVPESKQETRENLVPGAETQGVSAPEGYGTSYSERTPEPTADDFRQSVHNRSSADPFADFGIPEPVQEEPAVNEVSYEKFEYQTASESAYDSSRYIPEEPAPDLHQYAARQAYENSQPRGTRTYGGDYTSQRNAAVGTNAFRGGRPPETPYYETEETTVISRNTRISGDISSFANVNVEGSVQGDIKLTKNIAVSGKVVGNIECNNAVMTGAQMQGSISSKGQVQIDHDSVLLGNIDTQYLDLNGRIKGNVDVGGKAEFKNDAVIVGDITASTISVIDGAVIKGYVNTTFMQESTSNVFPEAISVGEA